MLLIAQSLNLLSGSVGPVPPGPIPVVVTFADGAGYPSPEYVPRVPKLALSAQYDAMLESGAIDIDEWIGLYLLHGSYPGRERQRQRVGRLSMR